MKKKYPVKLYYYINIIIIAFILIIDIYSKSWILKNLHIHETQKIFSMLNFFHVHNYGAAFSILADQKIWQKNFLSIFSVIVIFIMIKISITLKKKDKKKMFSFSCIIAGAIGNLTNRIQYGFVIDFIDIHINNWHFATFNIADCSIFIGILMIIKNHC